MSEEIRELKARLTALEVNVHKLVAFSSGVGQSFSKASMLVVSCVQCANAIDERVTCQEEACPCGLPFELAEEEQAKREDHD